MAKRFKTSVRLRVEEDHSDLLSGSSNSVFSGLTVAATEAASSSSSSDTIGTALVDANWKKRVKDNRVKRATGTSKPRTVKIHANMGGKSVTSDLVDTVTYTDNAHAEADSVELTLDNTSGDYLKKSKKKPTKGETGKAVFITKNYNLNSDSKISSGKMYVDSYTGSGSGTDTVGVTLISAPSYKGFSATSRTHTYKSTTVKTILKKIAKRNKLKLKYYGSTIKLKKIKQDKQTDSDFATELCERYGLRCKVYNGQLVVYDARRYHRKKPVATIKRSAIVGDYSYESSILGVYASATNTYQDKKKKKDKKVVVGHPKYKTKVWYTYTAKTKRKLAVRSKPSSKGRKLATLPKGKKYKIVKRYKNGWAKIVYLKKTKKKHTYKYKVHGASGSLERLLSVARSQIGYGNHYNSDGAAWCVDFAKWCYHHSGNGHKIAGLTERWVGAVRNYARRHGRWSHTPHPGDIVCLHYYGHVEIVYKVLSRNSIITIGGNTSWEHFRGYHKKTRSGRCVSMKHRRNNDGWSHFDGFFHPRWGHGTTETRTKTKWKTSSKDAYGYIYIGKKQKNVKLIRHRHTKKVMISRNLKVDTAGYNKSDAKRIAKAKLAQENEKVETLTLTMRGGNRKIVASSTVQLGSDWGGLKGKWFVDQVQHSYGASSAYTLALTLHRVTSANSSAFKTYRKVGSKVKFKGGYVHSSSKGGKRHKVKPQNVKICKVDKKGKYTYKIKSLPKYAKWKKRKVKVREYNRKTGAGGRKLNGNCCACDWLPIGSKIRIGSKTYTVADRTHGKGGILIWKKNPSSTVTTKTIKYKKLTKKSHVIGWVSSSEIASISKPKTSTTKKPKAQSQNKHKPKKGGITSHGKTFKVKATHKANYSCYALPYGSFIKRRVGSWTGMCCAAPTQLPIGSYVRIAGTHSEWDGKVMKVVDRGGVIYVHPNGEWWIDVHFHSGSAGYKRFLRKGRYHGKVQVLKKT